MNNGHGSLTGWTIAFAGGMTFIGKLVEFETIGASAKPCPRRLSPVYQLNVNVQQVAKDKVRIVFSAQPALLLPSFDSLDVDGAVLKPVGELGDRDRKELQEAVAIGEQMVLQMRASQSGLSLVGADATLVTEAPAPVAPGHGLVVPSPELMSLTCEALARWGQVAVAKRTESSRSTLTTIAAGLPVRRASLFQLNARIDVLRQLIAEASP